MGDLFCYEAHGLFIESTVELPTPEVASQKAIDVTIGSAFDSRWLPLTRPALLSRPDNLDDPAAIDHWTTDGLFVEFLGEALVRVDAQAITIVERMNDDDDALAHLLLDHVMPRVVSLRGDLMLHGAGAVGPSGFAHLFLGRSGMGKSTLSAALGAHGWPLVDDDGIRVQAVDGTYLAVPGYSGVRLLPDAAQAILPSVPPGRPMARGHRKRRFAVDGSALRMASGATPIGAVYLLDRALGDQPVSSRLVLGEGLIAVVEHAFHVASDHTKLMRQAFELSAALAAAVPMWSLRTPIGLDRMSATLAELGRLDEALRDADLGTGSGLCQPIA